MITFEMREDGVGVLWLDVPGAKQNTIQPELRAGLDAAMKALVAHGARAAVVASKKPRSFLAGADLRAFAELAGPEQAKDRARALQAELDRIETARIPFVAAIHGACLGGGLELALACRARIASDAEVTRLGLPEVKIGVLPAGGGTQRLPREVGLELALELMTTGRSIGARQALEIGLVREVVRPAMVVDVAAKVGLQLAAAPAKSLPERVGALADTKSLKELALTKTPAGRRLVFEQAKKAVTKAVGEHYPAPYEVLEVTRIGLEKGMKKGLAAEAEAFARLRATDTCRQLVNTFFATAALAKDNGTEQPNLQPGPVRRVGVFGAGPRGARITAATALQAGLPVRLRGEDDADVARGLRAVRTIVEEAGGRRGLRPLEIETQLLRVSGTTDATGFDGLDVVIDARDAPDLAALASPEAAGGPDTILALGAGGPVGPVAAHVSHPERVVGMYDLELVPRTPLLEVARTEQTADRVVATCVALGRQQGRTVIVVRDGIGYYTRRTLMPYINEGLWMIAEGVPVETIEAAAKAFGFEVGPLAMLDTLGVAAVATLAGLAAEAFGDRARPPAVLGKLVDTGHRLDANLHEALGVQPDRRRKHDLRALGERLALPLVNEATRCLEEGVLRSARDGDVGAIFGLGFPAITGGPFRWTDAIGPAELLRRTRNLEDRFGLRFRPSALLVERAASGVRFHG